MKIVATIEARTGSTRLPNKVLKPILGEPMLGRIVQRVSRSRLIDEIIIATTLRSRDESIVDLSERLGAECFRGSEDDILARLAGAVDASRADLLVSLTGDNPFIDPHFLDDMIRFFIQGRLDYAASTHMQHAKTWPVKRTFPTGISAQIVWGKYVLEQDEVTHDQQKRQLGLYSIYDRMDGRYCRGAFQATGKYAGWCHPEFRMTVDTREDFLLTELIYQRLYPHSPHFSTLDAINLLKENQALNAINQHIRQNLAYRELQLPC
jgi:spore coat polysaccharide biosynthesis protein SpsF